MPCGIVRREIDIQTTRTGRRSHRVTVVTTESRPAQAERSWSERLLAAIPILAVYLWLGRRRDGGGDRPPDADGLHRRAEVDARLARDRRPRPARDARRGRPARLALRRPDRARVVDPGHGLRVRRREVPERARDDGVRLPGVLRWRAASSRSRRRWRWPRRRRRSPRSRTPSSCCPRSPPTRGRSSARGSASRRSPGGSRSGCWARPRRRSLAPVVRGQLVVVPAAFATAALGLWWRGPGGRRVRSRLDARRHRRRAGAGARRLRRRQPLALPRRRRLARHERDAQGVDPPPRRLGVRRARDRDRRAAARRRARLAVPAPRGAARPVGSGAPRRDCRPSSSGSCSTRPSRPRSCRSRSRRGSRSAT